MRTSITDLPFDILFIIFDLCWERRTCPELPFPMIASHVCREWRQYALGTPSFWGVINIRDYQPQLEKYQTWLERSEESPLTIVLGGEPFDRRSIKNTKDIMRLIVPHANRWKSLKIWSVPQKIIQVIFDRLLDLPTPSLTELDVDPEYLRQRHVPAATKWRFRPFLRGGAPNLREIVIARLSCEYIDGRFPSLTVLDVVDAKLATEIPSVMAVKVQKILSRLPNLQVLRFSSELQGLGGRGEERNGIQSIRHVPQPITHASLVELSIQAPAPTRNTIISSLVLPEVRYFLDRLRDRPEEWEVALDVSCLRILGNSRPFPNLISLRLGGNPSLWQSFAPPSSGPPNGGPLASLGGALQGLPKLKALTFHQIHLGYGQQVHCLARACPLLEWLTLVKCVGYTFRDLQSMVVKRREMESMSPIKQIVSCGLYVREQDIPEWEAKEWLGEALEFVYEPHGAEHSEWDYLTRVENLI
ncbi:hypothetical protein FS837_005144 [Tulasnella sp. UAMH 9824]|nr:hypothetical protein FS837_005144 [Tulasnella sp. UAMH 9824]